MGDLISAIIQSSLCDVVFVVLFPGVEPPGYSRASLREEGDVAGILDVAILRRARIGRVPCDLP